MDSGNGTNQSQRYCPTPIMAPPTVATSPPLMSGGSVIGSMHQQPHHPPPSISPHPSAYYAHHSTGTSHYPTPSPTPPPMHHQQYYPHSYYAHGSHQHQQTQQSQVPHHGISNPNSHVPMNTQSSAPQPSHMMGGHGNYSHHHQQHQPHHQQWNAPAHPSHQQQSHHYYHQPTHHPGPHQQPHQQPPQQQQQQHVYPPPTQSPYPYMPPPHPTPTPPPSSSHPTQQQQHIQQSTVPPPQPTQQHQSAPQVPATSSQAHLHQPQQPSQQPPSHALMNLSRFVSQQSPSPPCPSPRASPSLASHHPQQIPQMGSQSPSTFSSHLDHHSTMNGHLGHSISPVMSSPPPPSLLNSQQNMSSPPPPAPQNSQPHQHLISQPQVTYNINSNSAASSVEKSNIVNITGQQSSEDNLRDSHNFSSDIANANKNSKSEQGNATSTRPYDFDTKDIDNAHAATSEYNNSDPGQPSPSLSENEKGDATKYNQATFLGTMNSGDSIKSAVQLESVDETTITADLLKTNGSGETEAFNWEAENGNARASVSPQSKPLGSPTSTGNGHQMMPVRLQNMQKGARTKASMKKLMQEQHSSTPNGQVSDVATVDSNSAKDVDVDLEMAKSEDVATNEKEKPAKSQKKRKSQTKSAQMVIPTNNDSEVIANMDLSTTSVPADPSVVVRPGYTKSGKKIGRPRKDSLPVSTGVVAEAKAKGKKGTKTSVTKKSTKRSVASTPGAPESSVEVLPTEGVDAIVEDVPRKRKVGKTSRKRSLEVSSDTNVVEDPSSPVVDLNAISQVQSSNIPASETDSSTPVVGKRRQKSKANTSDDTAISDLISQNMPSSSEISDQEAKSVALRVIQPTAPDPPRGRKKAKLKPTSEAAPEVKVPGSPNKRKANAQPTPAAGPPNEGDASPERGELPRLRSRSPKQRESPPLRISSPRAAKERSVTPAGTNTTTATPTRLRASKEKEVVHVSTPLSSPKKSSEKGSAKATSVSKRKKNLAEVSEVREELLSPPPSKRTRQMSKESSEAGESQKVTRKSRQSEARSSTEVDVSLLSPTIGKRTSRRKSGSVSGSTDDLSYPNSKTHGSTTFPASEISTETQSDSLITTSVDASSSSVALPVEQPLYTSTPMVSSKRGKAKKKVKSTNQKHSAKSNASLNSEVANQEPLAMQLVSDLENHDSTMITSTEIPIAKPKKQKKGYVKKGVGKKKSKALMISQNSGVDSVVQESNEPGEGISHTDGVKPAPPVEGKGKKSTKTVKKQKKNSKPIVSATSVLNIPKPSILVPKKKGRPKIEKPAKVGRKSGKSKETVLQQQETPMPVEELPVPLDEMKAFSPPSDLTLTKRRRSSAASSVNTQSNSAKSGIPVAGISSSALVKSETPTAVGGSTQSAPAIPKTHRRDSRSLSRDYDVSVVLTDIAHSWSSGDRSLGSNLSANLSFPSPPATSSSPQHSGLVGPTSPVKAELSKPSLGVALEVGNPDHPISVQTTKKRQSKSKLPTIKQSGVSKKSKKERAPTKQEKKIKAEEEVAQILLNLNPEIANKSPSPTKAIISVNSIDTATKKKIRKPRKMKNSDIIANHSSTEETENSTLNSSLNPASLISNDISPPIASPEKKSVKRKKLKESRSPIDQPIAQTSLQPFAESFGSPGSSGSISDSTPRSLPLNTNCTSVKVLKTAQIPTATSLGIADQSVTAPKGRPKKEKGVKAAKAKLSKRGINISEYSPDITTIPPESSISSTPTGSKKRKRSVKSVVKMGESKNAEEGPIAVAEDSEAVSTSEELKTSAKKKRPRKQKGVVEGEPPKASKPTSRLFPYRASSPPSKRPVVLAKSVPGIVVDKDDDNQKKKTQDVPTLRVIGGKTKFYRGGEEEEVDQDPKLPKEKGPLQTDSDVPWECSFCHLGPHAQKLGDLFGPYFADLPSIYGKPSMKRETWMHGDCALWAGRLILVGTYLRRLEETLRNADKETCTICKKTGATIGCLKRGCKEAVHYPCAVRRFWKMDGQNFHSYCPLHKS